MPNDSAQSLLGQMRKLYFFKTRAGTFYIAEHNGRFHPLFEGENLGSSLPWQDLRPSYCFGPLTGPTPTLTKSAGAAPSCDSQ